MSSATTFTVATFLSRGSAWIGARSGPLPLPLLVQEGSFTKPPEAKYDAFKHNAACLCDRVLTLWWPLDDDLQDSLHGLRAGVRKGIQGKAYRHCPGLCQVQWGSGKACL